MEFVDFYTTTRYCSTRAGGTHDPQRYDMGKMAEIYAPAINPNDWYQIRTIGVMADGKEMEVSLVIVKR